MRLVEKIVKRNLRRYLNEMDVTNRRESTNVEDRRGEKPSTQQIGYEEYALSMCRDIQVKLKRLVKCNKFKEFLQSFGKNERRSRYFAKKLIKIEIPRTNNVSNDYTNLLHKLPYGNGGLDLLVYKSAGVGKNNLTRYDVYVNAWFHRFNLKLDNYIKWLNTAPKENERYMNQFKNQLPKDTYNTITNHNF